jgi:predicted enzyme related to lactoylglutathione lyase
MGAAARERRPTRPSCTNPVVHLELHTGDVEGARSFYSELLRWRGESVQSPAGSYDELHLGPLLGGGVVACGTPRAMWLPYVSVQEVGRATDRAVELGARLLLAPREGPCGWRSVVSTPAGGEIALWQLRGLGRR